MRRTAVNELMCWQHGLVFTVFASIVKILADSFYHKINLILQLRTFIFLVRRELKDSQCLRVCPWGIKSSKALNLHLSLIGLSDQSLCMPSYSLSS